MRGSHAYLASSAGLEFVGVRDTGAPASVVRWRDPGDSEGVAISDGIVYVAAPAKWLVVIDATNPSSLKTITTLAGTRGAWAIHIHKHHLYLAYHGSGIRILDISEKKAPQIIGRFNDAGNWEALGVWGDGEYLYVADNFGVGVLDVRHPRSPHEIAQYRGLRGSRDICFDGQRIYVAEAIKGLIILELTEEP